MRDKDHLKHSVLSHLKSKLETGLKIVICWRKLCIQPSISRRYFKQFICMQRFESGFKYRWIKFLTSHLNTKWNLFEKCLTSYKFVVFKNQDCNFYSTRRVHVHTRLLGLLMFGFTVISLKFIYVTFYACITKWMFSALLNTSETQGIIQCLKRLKKK